MQRLRAKLFQIEIDRQESDTRSSRKKQVAQLSPIYFFLLKYHHRLDPVFALKKSAPSTFLRIGSLTTEQESLCTTFGSSCLVARHLQSLTKNSRRENDKKSFKHFWPQSASSLKGIFVKLKVILLLIDFDVLLLIYREYKTKNVSNKQVTYIYYGIHIFLQY